MQHNDLIVFINNFQRAVNPFLITYQPCQASTKSPLCMSKPSGIGRLVIALEAGMSRPHLEVDKARQFNELIALEYRPLILKS